ncbi:aldehyde dehydrogenase family protein [Streptomyces sp. BK340]|uniref:aldehyde dehydrogenase family protein n=1 Tax=Streptomyces sp. BK340 TaxID=2572903 RepID=UPI0037DA4C4B
MTGTRVVGDVTEVGGLYYRPILLTDAAPDAAILTEEVSGHALPLQTFDAEEEAIQLVNGTRIGLAAALATGDPNRAACVSEELVADTRNNCFFDRDLQVPFGGSRRADAGREGGTWSFHFYGDVMNAVTAQKGWHARG